MPGIVTLTAASATPCKTLASAEIIKNNCESYANDAIPNVRVARAIIRSPNVTQFFLPRVCIQQPKKGAVNKNTNGQHAMSKPTFSELT